MSNSEETPLGNWRHICVDMQRMFAEDTPWHVPWMKEVSPPSHRSRVHPYGPDYLHKIHNPEKSGGGSRPVAPVL
jgi:hypothetical protein